MKKLILFFILTTTLFSQVDSMRVTWAEANDADLYGTIIFADSVTNPPTTARDTVLAGTEFLEWQPNKTGLWYVGAKSLDDSGNVSAMSNIDTVTIWQTAAPTYPTPDAELVYNLGLTNVGDSVVTSWVDQQFSADFKIAPGYPETALQYTDSMLFCNTNSVNDVIEFTEAGANPFDFGTGDFTIEFRVWTITPQAAAISRVMQKGSVAPYWRVYADNATPPYYVFQLVTAGGAASGYYQLTANLDSTTTVVTFRLDRNVGLSIFIDGDSVVAGLSGANFVDLTEDVNNDAVVGVGNRYTGEEANGYKGGIVGIRAWNDALTAAEVQASFEDAP